MGGTTEDTVKPRAETGPLRFGDDWNGVFIRGDNAMHYARVLRGILENPELLQRDVIGTRIVIEGLAQTLSGANQFNPSSPVQVCKDFADCQKE